MSREIVLNPLIRDQAVFLWNNGNRNSFRTYDDGSEASVDLDEWGDVIA